MKLSQITTITITSFAFIAFCPLATFTTHALTQSNTRPSPLDRRIDHMSRQREQHDRDTLRRPDGEPHNPIDRKPSQAAIIEIKQDFERIQEVYNEIVLAMSGDRAPQYGQILDATAEIKKCANRLRKNLALPAPDNRGDREQGVDLKEGEIKASLRRLCLHIANFVTNPVFETLVVVDVEQSNKAGRDLEEIIGLSDLVWRSTKSLGEAKK